MSETQAAFTSVAILFLFPLATYAQMETSSHKVRGNRCVNLRAEPSINAAVVNCLQPNTDVQVFRLPPTGRFIWVKDQADRIWYRATVPGTNAVGWIMPVCTDIFSDTNEEPCTDYGTMVVAQNIRGRNGVIQGSLSYPGEEIPTLTLCAQSTNNYREIQCIKTKSQQKKFKITVPPGEYYIFSYEKNGFQDASTGKFSSIIMYHANWEDNSNPIPIRVSAGKTVSGVIPQNYAICQDRNPTPAYCIEPKS